MNFSIRVVIISIVLVLALILYAFDLAYEMKFTLKHPKLHNTTSLKASLQNTSTLESIIPWMANTSYKKLPQSTKLKSDEAFVIHKLRIRYGGVRPENLMTSGPFDFLPNYRNPCWRVETEKFPPIKCLPYFYLVGAPKAGTTDLYYRIVRHPNISFLSVKEPHWLPRLHFYAKSISGVWQTLDSYINIFRNTIKDIYRIKEENDWHPKVFGDGSASTLWDNDYWNLLPEFEHLSEPVYTNADYIHHLNPKTKIIAILRNPIDRLYSDYLFFHSIKSSGGFHDAVVESVGHINTCLLNNTLRHCVYQWEENAATNTVRVRIGIYFIHLKEFFRVFPRTQIHVIKLEEYSKNINASLKEVFNFLDVEPLTSDELAKISTKNNKNTRRPKDKAIGEMLPETRKLLQQFYRPYNEELAKLLGEKFNYNTDESEIKSAKLQKEKLNYNTDDNDINFAKLQKEIFNRDRDEYDIKSAKLQREKLHYIRLENSTHV